MMAGLLIISLILLIAALKIRLVFRGIMKSKKVTLQICGIFFILSVFTGCVSDVPIKQVPVAKPIDVLASQKQQPIMFKKVVVKIKRGEVIGTIHAGLLEVPQAHLYWRSGGYVDFSDDDFNDRFREDLEAANYKVVGNPDALFEDPSDWEAELLVAGLITDLKINVYFPQGGLGNYSYSKGDAYLKVDWQIFSRLDRKIVLNLTTEGSVHQNDCRQDGANDALGDAFSEAVSNLLARQEFHNLVVSSASTKMEGASVSLDFKDPNLTNNVVDQLPDIKTSVVTLFAGDEMGSGFIVSNDGYILSDQHVVGDARYVRIKFSTGIEADGEVVSKNRMRDVALIKCGEQGLKSLAIRRSLPKTGEEVYAIGTPIEEKFDQTVTKGIVSGFRTMDGIDYIQSDVAINPGNSGGPLLDKNGNVVGMTVLKRTDAESLNFFIPIDEAIKALDIK
jgi:serine protease Do